MVDAAFSLTLLPWLDAVTPRTRFLVALMACVVAGVALWWRAWLHRQRLAAIPVRVHVAGTRGKSSTVRLIAAGLRANGHRVVAKVTGARPRLILPDGTERPVRRWGAPAIREQQAFVAAARRAGANAIVAEAMAIEPEYLRALERFYIRATDLVITNVRPDHQEQLGAAPDAMAQAVAEAVPSGGRLFVTAEAAVPVVLERAAAQRCEVSIAAGPPDADPEDANWQIAIDVCRQYGAVDEAAMRAAARDIGAFAIGAWHVDGRQISFANAFSCNDVESFERLWRRHQPADRPAAFLFNPRDDRPIRTREFLKLIARLAPDARLFVIGGNRALRRRAVIAGFGPDHIHLLPRTISAASLRMLATTIPDDAVVWGAGNFKGAGAELTARIAASHSPC
jgi:poly-gamma-glutamate synthase PgsB/CapB